MFDPLLGESYPFARIIEIIRHTGTLSLYGMVDCATGHGLIPSHGINKCHNTNR